MRLTKKITRKSHSKFVFFLDIGPRTIEEDEKAIGYNCGRFGKKFLFTLNERLEKNIKELGVECKRANGAGSKFDPQRLNRTQREESVALHKQIKKLQDEQLEIETRFVAAQQELEEKFGERANQIMEIFHKFNQLKEKWNEAKTFTQMEKIDKQATDLLTEDYTDIEKTLHMFINEHRTIGEDEGIEK